MKPPRPLARRRKWPVSRCKPDWSAEQQLAYYTTVDPLSGCRIWQGSRLKSGYGAIRVHRKDWLTHRLAWTLKHGPIPAGMILCHRCDERRCCNPDHLFLGTHGDNMADFKAKRLTRSEARARNGAAIRIIYRGVELVGEVKVAAVDPRVAAVADKAKARPTRSMKSPSTR